MLEPLPKARLQGWIAPISGGVVAELYAALTGVVLYTPAQGILSPLSFLGGDQMNMVNDCIAIGLGMIVSLVVACSMVKQGTQDDEVDHVRSCLAL